MKEYLEKIARKDLATDDEEFDPQDWCGGNFDDAFEMGTQAGEIMLARELLEKYFQNS